MANRVTMSICGTEYILVAEEDAAYMEKIGSMVDAEMQKLMDSAHMSRDAAAVLAAVNLADQLTKAQEGAENLRRQVKTYLDVSLKRFDTVFRAVGSAASAIELTCDELERCCGDNFVEWVDVCKGWQDDQPQA